VLVLFREGDGNWYGDGQWGLLAVGVIGVGVVVAQGGWAWRRRRRGHLDISRWLCATRAAEGEVWWAWNGRVILNVCVGESGEQWWCCGQWRKVRRQGWWITVRNAVTRESGKHNRRFGSIEALPIWHTLGARDQAALVCHYF